MTKSRGIMKTPRQSVAEHDADVLASLHVMFRLQAQPDNEAGITITTLATRVSKGRYAIRDRLDECVARGVATMTQNHKKVRYYKLLPDWEQKLQEALAVRDAKKKALGDALQARSPGTRGKVSLARAKRWGHPTPQEKSTSDISPALLQAAKAFAAERWPGVRTTWHGARPAALGAAPC